MAWADQGRGMVQRCGHSVIDQHPAGVGVDFNTELVESITKTKGANYYSLHTPGQLALPPEGLL